MSQLIYIRWGNSYISDGPTHIYQMDQLIYIRWGNSYISDEQLIYIRHKKARAKARAVMLLRPIRRQYLRNHRVSAWVVVSTMRDEVRVWMCMSPSAGTPAGASEAMLCMLS